MLLVLQPGPKMTIISLLKATNEQTRKGIFQASERHRNLNHRNLRCYSVVEQWRVKSCHQCLKQLDQQENLKPTTITPIKSPKPKLPNTSAASPEHSSSPLWPYPATLISPRPRQSRKAPRKTTQRRVPGSRREDCLFHRSDSCRSRSEEMPYRRQKRTGWKTDSTIGTACRHPW